MNIPNFSSQLDNLKRCVKDMKEERDNIFKNHDTALPSPIWTDLTNIFEYLMNLSEKDFRNIRYHSGMITGGTSWDRWFEDSLIDPDLAAKNLGYINAIKDVPEEYRIGEPTIPGILRPIGVLYKGAFINREIAKYQQCVSNLYHTRILNDVINAKDKQLIFEIGGGYGGLAHAIGEIVGLKATYVIVDLPDMFMFQGSYLALNNPQKSIYVYDPKTFNSEFVLKEIYDYDFVLIPNYALKKLHLIKNIAAMINLESFQEMDIVQIEEYLEFGAERITGYLYSDNVDRYHKNNDLVSLTELLKKQFELYPSPDYYDKLYGRNDMNYKKYSGISKRNGETFPNDFRMTNLSQGYYDKLSNRKLIALKLARIIIPLTIRRMISPLLKFLR